MGHPQDNDRKSYGAPNGIEKENWRKTKGPRHQPGALYNLVIDLIPIYESLIPLWLQHQPAIRAAFNFWAREVSRKVAIVGPQLIKVVVVLTLRIGRLTG
jgi:hypothetical protein